MGYWAAAVGRFLPSMALGERDRFIMFWLPEAPLSMEPLPKEEASSLRGGFPPDLWEPMALILD